MRSGVKRDAVYYHLTMTYQFSQRLLVLQALLLLIGTQMPSAWRTGIEASLHAPFGLSSWAHFVLFAGMAVVAFARPLVWPWPRVLLAALALALATEGLQFFALDRHPRMLDVVIDLAGALAGVALVMVVGRFKKVRNLPR